MEHELASTEPRLFLERDEAHLHVLRLSSYEQFTEATLLARFGRWMNDEEKERQARFVFDRGRREYLMTRALVRTTLSRYADVLPEAWRFTLNRWGKPSIEGALRADRGGGASDAELRFNLSNTEGCVVCLVARGREIGVDVEYIDRDVSFLDLAESRFAKREHAALVRLPESEHRARFFAHWTLKEAYIKARGMGLALPLDKFAFDLDRGDPPLFHAEPEVDADPAAWQFDRFVLGRAHVAATAIPRRTGGERDRTGLGAAVRIVRYDAAASPALRT